EHGARRIQLRRTKQPARACRRSADHALGLPELHRLLRARARHSRRRAALRAPRHAPGARASPAGAALSSSGGQRHPHARRAPVPRAPPSPSTPEIDAPPLTRSFERIAVQPATRSYPPPPARGFGTDAEAEGTIRLGG